MRIYYSENAMFKWSELRQELYLQYGLSVAEDEMWQIHPAAMEPDKYINIPYEYVRHIATSGDEISCDEVIERVTLTHIYDILEEQKIYVDYILIANDYYINWDDFEYWKER